MTGSEPQPSQPVDPAQLTGFMAPHKIDNYRSERGAKAYFEDHQKKLHRKLSDRRERKILREFLGLCGPIDRMLDAPSGFGRLLDLFREYADHIVESDFSETMLALNEQLHGNGTASYLHCSALEIPRPDRTFAVAASIRLSHHLESVEDRLRHIRELCRVSQRHVIMTYFSATSLKNRLRRMRSMWNGKRAKNVLSAEQVAEEFARSGFRVVQSRPLARIGSGHVYVLASRVDGAAG